MESVDADSEMDEILKKTQETTPEGNDTSDAGTRNTPNAQTSSSRDSPTLIEAITLFQKALAVHGAGSSGQENTRIISSKEDTNKGPTYNQFLNEILQDLEKCVKRGPPVNENIAKLFQNLVYNDINIEKLENLLKEVLPPENITGLEANKVTSEIWQQIAHQTKSFDLKLQNLQKLILRSLPVLSKTANTLYEHRSEKDLTKLVALVKATIKSCADTAVLLEVSIIISKCASLNESNKTGAISECLKERERRTSDKWFVETIKGAKIDVNNVKKIPLKDQNFSERFSQTVIPLIQKEINLLLKKGVIIEVSAMK